MTKEKIKEYLEKDYEIIEVTQDTCYAGCDDHYYLLYHIDTDPYFYIDERAYNHIQEMDIPTYILDDNFDGKNLDELDVEDFDSYCMYEADNLLCNTNNIELLDEVDMDIEIIII